MPLSEPIFTAFSGSVFADPYFIRDNPEIDLRYVKDFLNTGRVRGDLSVLYDEMERLWIMYSNHLLARIDEENVVLIRYFAEQDGELKELFKEFCARTEKKLRIWSEIKSRPNGTRIKFCEMYAIDGAKIEAIRVPDIVENNNEEIVRPTITIDAETLRQYRDGFNVLF
jgi:hypothetical protein